MDQLSDLSIDHIVATGELAGVTKIAIARSAMENEAA
jgi:hypothetical protein